VTDKGYGNRTREYESVYLKILRVPVVSTPTSGHWLGLTFVREIMDAHGGYVTAESELGVGSTFTLRLPLELKDSHKINGSTDD